MGSKDLLLVAGEASGDLHGARLLQELRNLGFEDEAFGLGGDELKAAGLDSTAHSSEISVVGIIEVLKILRRARQIFAELLEQVDRRRPMAAVLIDFPEFNLRLAKALRQREVPVIYYIGPQVWAWRRGRVKTIARLVDKMLVLFPFEVDFYRHHGVEAIHVGHPLVDEVPQLPQAWDHGVQEGQPFHVSLLPGSRRSEVEVLLPILLAAARRLAEELPVRFSLIRASTISRQELEAALEHSGLSVTLVSADRFRTIASSHLALCAAGTATLEVGLLGTPMIVTHRVHLGSYLLGRLLVRLPYASLVNLLLDQEAVPELLQRRARPDQISRQAVDLLTDRDKIRQVRTSLSGLRERIGPPGASRRAALQVLSYLTGGSAIGAAGQP
ncbi:MAG: lipid-A-disaccharide synthase [Thermoanaerobaculia bacterium]